MKVQTLLLAIVVSLTLSSASLAAPKTTAPGNAVLVYVTITEKGISTAMYATTKVSGTDTLMVQLSVSRGEIAYFVVRNHGKKQHDFTVLGKKTPKLAPGAKASFHMALLRRGSFPYRSTLDKGKPQFRGLFTVG